MFFPKESSEIFYGRYVSDRGLSLDIQSADPFYQALHKVVAVYIAPRSLLRGFRCQMCLGLIVEEERLHIPENRFFIYVARDLSHSDRLTTIAHELIHLVLTEQGFPLDKHWNDEPWIDNVAKRFYQRNPSFLDWVYKDYVRIVR